MPVFEHVTALACPPARLFDFLARPANLVQVWPPELHPKVTDASERFALGSRFTVTVRRFGIPQSMTSEITAFEEGVGFIDVQVKGTFAKLVHAHRVEPDGTGCKMFDRVEYEAPGGLVGLYLTNERIREELEASFRYRDERFRAILEEKG